MVAIATAATTGTQMSRLNRKADEKIPAPMVCVVIAASDHEPVRKAEGALWLTHALGIERAAPAQRPERRPEENSHGADREQQDRLAQSESDPAARRHPKRQGAGRGKTDDQRREQQRARRGAYAPPGIAHLGQIVRAHRARDR